MSNQRRGIGRALFAACVVVWAAGMSGCAGFSFDFGGSSDLTLVSSRTGGSLAPGFTTAVFLSPDPNTADVYLSDLPYASLTAPDTEALDNAAGSIVHIHYFITPAAGLTPIDFQATNVAIRYIVLAPAGVYGEAPTIGIYGGGGFLLPSVEPEEDELSGRMEEATLRLTEAAAGFNDRIATGLLGGHVRATRDEAGARAIGANIAAMLIERESKPAKPEVPNDALTPPETAPSDATTPVDGEPEPGAPESTERTGNPG